MSEGFKERWQPVPGLEKDYEVSSLGRVRRISQARAGRHANKPLPYILSPFWSGPTGYPKLRVKLVGRETMQLAHLVAEVFIGPRPECDSGNNQWAWVRHQDGNPANCAAANLEWTTEGRRTSNNRQLEANHA